jgi:hypothetical protein
MHAKRTRDRKKKLLESSETQISRMERESHLLRGYCVSLNMLSAEEASKCEERTCESKRELAALKVNTSPSLSVILDYSRLKSSHTFIYNPSLSSYSPNSFPSHFSTAIHSGFTRRIRR